MESESRLPAAIARMPDFIVGGAACLDFANTVEPRGGGDASKEPTTSGHGDPRRDYLLSYVDLIAWSHVAGLISNSEAARLIGLSDAHQKNAAAIFERAITLREAIYRVFLAIARSTLPAPADLATITSAHHQTHAHAYLSPSNGGFAWSWPAPHRDPIADLESPLWPVARSAVDLLTTADPAGSRSAPASPIPPSPASGSSTTPARAAPAAGAPWPTAAGTLRPNASPPAAAPPASSRSAQLPRSNTAYTANQCSTM